MSDLLNLEYINSLPQPLIAKLYGDTEWPVYDIDVETGLCRIDVCGQLDITHIGNISVFKDAAGVEHKADDFYIDQGK